MKRTLTNAELRKLPINQPEHYEKLKEHEKTILASWIESCVKTNERTMLRHSSYRLKHIAEKQCDFYISNGQFKGAMLAAGYEPIDTRFINWKFKRRK